MYIALLFVVFVVIGCIALAELRKKLVVTGEIKNTPTTQISALTQG